MSNLVNSQTLTEIQRQLAITKDFSANDNQRLLEKMQARNIILEPLRKLEFNVLLALITNLTYKPYDSAKIKDNCIKIHMSEISLPNPEKQDYLTITCLPSKTNYWFSLKESYKAFSDIDKIKSDKLYNQLWSLCISKDLKVLYYFLYKYRYDFLTTIRYQIPVIYDNLKVIDSYLYEQGYHKKLFQDDN